MMLVCPDPGEVDVARDAGTGRSEAVHDDT